MSERPEWCPVKACRFYDTGGNKACVGHLAKDEEEKRAGYQYRICFKNEDKNILGTMLKHDDMQVLKELIDAIS